MLSDESSSDSETGRFKCTSKAEQKKDPAPREDKYKSVRSRPSENDRMRRDFDRRRARDRYERPRSRDRYRHPRHSPTNRKYSRERSPKRSRDRYRNRRNSRGKSKSREKSSSRNRHSRSKSHKKEAKDEKKSIVTPESTPDTSTKRIKSPCDEVKGKKSEIHRPATEPIIKQNSPIIVEHALSDKEEQVQVGSYYNMIPAIVKEKSEESSEIDSSDDEKLRAKLLNLEKQLHKSKRKKHRKKHRRRGRKDKSDDTTPSVEVTSTTDIQDQVTVDNSLTQTETTEVSSTQKTNPKESSEEGEILSDDSQNPIDIDPNDLRHKLKKKTEKRAQDVCGPALPPHLESKFRRSRSCDIEGPVLPPHMKDKNRNIGPSIPDDMRQVLASKEVDDVKYVSSDEDLGIGPLPESAEKKWSDAHIRLEERALNIKMKQIDGQTLNSADVKSREQWMLELPESKAKYLGLEARSFRAKAGPDMSDRSCWTDTPEEKARKASGLDKDVDPDVALQKEARSRHIEKRDEEQELAARKHKKKHKREESLLDIHQKKLKKKKKKDEKESDKKERRPFSRDVDLQVNRFDDAQKKSIIKKAQQLDSRFSRGEAKYL